MAQKNAVFCARVAGGTWCKTSLSLVRPWFLFTHTHTHTLDAVWSLKEKLFDKIHTVNFVIRRVVVVISSENFLRCRLEFVARARKGQERERVLKI